MQLLVCHLITSHRRWLAPYLSPQKDFFCLDDVIKRQDFSRPINSNNMVEAVRPRLCH
jgi:hypothetical protein